MKKYESPELNSISLSVSDIITTSKCGESVIEMGDYDFGTEDFHY